MCRNFCIVVKADEINFKEGDLHSTKALSSQKRHIPKEEIMFTDEAICHTASKKFADPSCTTSASATLSGLANKRTSSV